MNTAVAVSHTHADWRASEAARATMLAHFDRQINNLAACVRYLTHHGIVILRVDLRRGRDRPRLHVVRAPALHMLFRDDAASIGQHWDAWIGQTVHDWLAIRYECEVRWEELS